MMHLVALGEDKERCSLERRKWLAKETSGKRVAVAERIGAIDEDDVFFSFKFPVLETIIQKQHVCAKGDGFLSRREAILSYENGNAREL